MTFLYRLSDGSKADHEIHNSILSEGDKKWEGSKVQQDTINRFMKDFGVDYETAKRLFSASNQQGLA